MRDKYERSIGEHHDQKDAILNKISVLHDQLILVKLAITQAMMQQYQNNERPDIERLEDILQDYEQLIEETKVWME